MPPTRYLVLHTSSAAPNTASGGPDARTGSAGHFHDGLARAGVLRDAVALRPDSEGVRIRFQDGQAVVEHGPFADAYALTGFCTIEVEAREQALDALGRCAQDASDSERFELRESGCPGGVMAVMADHGARDPACDRYAILLRNTAHLDADRAAPQPRLDAMTRRNQEGAASGVLLAGEGLKGSARGVRMGVVRGVPSLTDGPFTEVKEMVAGYWVIQARTLAEAIEWVRAYPYPVDDAVVDIRAIEELATGPADAGERAVATAGD